MITAVDGRAFAAPAGGVRRYVAELYGAFAPLGNPTLVHAIGAPTQSDLPAVCRRYDEPPSPPTNLGRHAVGLPLALRRSGAAVYHAPAYVAPLWGAIPTVVSIHDIVYASRPEWYPYQRDPLRRWFYRHSAGRARLILAPSAFTAQELMRVYGIPSASIRVVPLAPSDVFRAAHPAPAEVRQPVLLHVGDVHARRDLASAVSVLARLNTSGSRAWRLVLIGQDRGCVAGVLAAATAAGVGSSVTHIPQVSDADLRDWYDRAYALIYPSRYEGFGLPVAEAMAAGLPVVAAQAGSVPEVLGGAGDVFAAGDVSAAVAAVERLTDPTHYLQRQQCGLRRAAALSWTRTAQLTLEALEEAAGA